MRERPTRARWSSAVAAVLAGATSLLLIAAAALFLQGGRWFVVSTPSMGEAAPVGTLVITMPATLADVPVGSIVSFRPPNRPTVTFTHRLVADKRGIGTTRGDINGSPDPWPLTQTNLIGQAVLVLPGFGWLIRVFPPLLGGALISWVLTAPIRHTAWQRSLRNFGVSASAAFVIAEMRPFVGAETVVSQQLPSGLDTTVVSTGLLPIRLGSAPSSIHLTSGQVGRILIQPTGHPAHFALDMHLDPTPSQWALIAAFCLLPAIIGTVLGTRPTRHLTTGAA